MEKKNWKKVDQLQNLTFCPFFTFKNTSFNEFIWCTFTPFAVARLWPNFSEKCFGKAFWMNLKGHEKKVGKKLSNFKIFNFGHFFVKNRNFCQFCKNCGEAV